MDVNTNITNVVPVDLKAQGNNASTHNVQEKKVDDAAAKLEVEKHKELNVAEKKVDLEELQIAVDKINKFVQITHKDLSFSVHEESGRDVVSILDTKSREILKQYPSEEILKLAVELGELSGTDAMDRTFSLFTSEA